MKHPFGARARNDLSDSVLIRQVRVVNANGPGEAVEAPRISPRAEDKVNLMAVLQEAPDEIRSQEPRATRQECTPHGGTKRP